MRIEDWLGEDNELGCDIWHKKYQYDDELILNMMIEFPEIGI